jgi:hypothetical protein
MITEGGFIMSQQHTPGPWRIIKTGIDVRSGPIGCLAYVSTAGARGRTLDEAKAIARLIAAAPDLLAACESIVLFPAGDIEDVLQRARIAISKARDVSPPAPSPDEPERVPESA